MNQTNQSSYLKRRIMRRVYFHWFLRQTPPLALQGAVILLLLVGIHEFVSVRFVLANFSEVVSAGAHNAGPYLVSALANTGLMAQALFAATLLLGALLFRDFAKALRRLRSASFIPERAG